MDSLAVLVFAGYVGVWLCCRWMLVGAYVGFATVGVFCAWYMFDNFLGIDLSGDGHTTVTWHQLRKWESCHTWSDFKVGLSDCSTSCQICIFLLLEDSPQASLVPHIPVFPWRCLGFHGSHSRLGAFQCQRSSGNGMHYAVLCNGYVA